MRIWIKAKIVGRLMNLAVVHSWRLKLLTRYQLWPEGGAVHVKAHAA